MLPRQRAKMRRGPAVIVFCMCIHAGADRNNLDKGEIWEHKNQPIFRKGPTSCASSQPIPAFVQPLQLASEDVAFHNFHNPPFLDRQSDIDRDRDNPGGQDGVARTDAAGSAGACRRRVRILQPTAGACFFFI